MIFIHVWPGIGVIGSGGNVGHGSMTCGSTYLSWWPASGGVGLGDAITHMTVGHQSLAERYIIRTTVPGATEVLSTDVASEGNRHPNSYNYFNMFDEAAILRAWSAWQRVGTYNLAERSCCSSVVAMLEAGGLSEVFPNYRSFLSSSLASRRVVSPNDLMTLARALQTNVRPERSPTMSSGGRHRR